MQKTEHQKIPWPSFLGVCISTPYMVSLPPNLLGAGSRWGKDYSETEQGQTSYNQKKKIRSLFVDTQYFDSYAALQPTYSNTTYYFKSESIIYTRNLISSTCNDTIPNAGEEAFAIRLSPSPPLFSPHLYRSCPDPVSLAVDMENRSRTFRSSETIKTTAICGPSTPYHPRPRHQQAESKQGGGEGINPATAKIFSH